MSSGPQLADPSVSRAKFEREVEEFRLVGSDYSRRGWLLVEAQFPRVFVVMAAPQLTPPPVVTGVLLDYTDYDIMPPSVRLADPFTREPYKASELPTNLLRQVLSDGLPMGLSFPAGMAAPRIMQQQPLMQAYAPEELPFLCIAGVREYHEHPAHSGDRWELHRRDGAGRLVRILEIIDRYGVRPLNGYGVNLIPQVSGLTQAEVPE
ncbi:MAG: putative metal-binding protein [Solirubrobacteraceae bacterium]